MALQRGALTRVALRSLRYPRSRWFFFSLSMRGGPTFVKRLPVGRLYLCGSWTFHQRTVSFIRVSSYGFS